jgi:hypothetical protein
MSKVDVFLVKPLSTGIRLRANLKKYATKTSSAEFSSSRFSETLYRRVLWKDSSVSCPQCTSYAVVLSRMPRKNRLERVKHNIAKITI